MKIDGLGWQEIEISGQPAIPGNRELTLRDGGSRPRGGSAEQPLFGCTPAQWRLLISSDSLTKRLSLLSNNQTQVKLLRTEQVLPTHEECELLDGRQEVWQRESIHVFQTIPWVWARVLIPENTLTNAVINIHSNQSIGDTLFQDPQLQRTHLEVSLLSAHHPYYVQANQFLGGSPKSLLARRSLLWFQKHPLYIAEVFLPDLLAYAENS